MHKILKCIKFLIFGLDVIYNSHFKNANKCLNKSWWNLFKICLFYNQTQIFLWDPCTFSMEENKCLSTRSGYCQCCACVVCMTNAIFWPNCIFAIARSTQIMLCRDSYLFWVLSWNGWYVKCEGADCSLPFPATKKGGGWKEVTSELKSSNNVFKMLQQ